MTIACALIASLALAAIVAVVIVRLLARRQHHGDCYSYEVERMIRRDSGRDCYWSAE